MSYVKVIYFLAFYITQTCCVYKADYCKLLSESNTVCMFDCATASSKCGTVLNNDYLSNDEIKILLHTHNKLRNKQAGGLSYNNLTATNMNILGYSKEIEYNAKCWVHQCKLSNDKPVSPNYPRGQGQNIAKRKATKYKPLNYNTSTLQSITEEWFNASKLYGKGDTYSKNKAKPEIDHYTQLVWAETKAMGCAKILTKRKVEEVLLVCNYGPAGNIPGMHVFKRGPIGEECKEMNEKYKNLCGKTPPFPLDPNFEGDTCNNRANFRLITATITIMIIL